MKPLDLPLFLDENLGPEVLTALRERGRDVVAARELGLAGQDDSRLLDVATRDGRVVLTHDRDFGALVIRSGQPYLGVIYLRPGHIDSGVVLQMLAVLEETIGDVEPPFVIVVEHKQQTIRVRLRKIP